MIEYFSDKMPDIPNMYDISDLFANFANNWFHLRYVFSLLFGISFGFWLIKRLLGGMDEVISIGEAASRVSDRAAQVGESMRHRAGIAAEIAKEKAAAAAERAKERAKAALDSYGDNYLRRMELRHEAKEKFRENMDAMREQQREAVVFLAALGARRERNDY